MTSYQTFGKYRNSSLQWNPEAVVVVHVDAVRLCL
jgi:hypothetical protein